MKTLIKNGHVVNLLTETLEDAAVLIDGMQIVGVGDYTDGDADTVIDAKGKYIAPAFIDGHIHIESTMLTPAELARVALLHGTGSIVCDPHEIGNVAGTDGIRYMLESSEGLPMNVFVMLPSCVPATPLDESGAVLTAEDIRPLYGHPRVLGLAEMMNFPGVLAKDEGVLQKLSDAKRMGKVINGHAPMLTGRALDAYIAAGVRDDHECSSADEAMEKLRRGQYIMVREGTAAHNLESLLPLLAKPYDQRCLFVTDDRHPADLLRDGHIDHVVRRAVSLGVPVMTALACASRRAAERFGLQNKGIIAPGYDADIILLDSLENLHVTDVLTGGEVRVRQGALLPFDTPSVSAELVKSVNDSFHLEKLTASDFAIVGEGDARAIQVIAGELLTREARVPFKAEAGGFDLANDVLKMAVIERHHQTGHRCVGLVKGIGLQRGAIASSVSHDSHNLIVIGTNDEDMVIAANRVIEMGGGNAVAEGGKIIAEMPLPIGGVMSGETAETLAAQNERVRREAHALGAHEGIEPFMNMAFLSLPVIPSLKMTTQGIFNVDEWRYVPLFY